MIIPDVNVLIYAIDATSAKHEVSRSWWDEALSSDARVGLCLPVITGFVRLTTHRRVFAKPLPVALAIERVNQWLEQPFADLLTPSPRHWEIMQELILALQAAANLTTDCDIAAYAIAYNADVATNDGDFQRIPGVRCFDPTG